MPTKNEKEQSKTGIANGDTSLSALESAESYVAGCAATGGAGDGGGKEFASSFEALIDWAEPRSLILREEEFDFFRRLTDGHGEEHEAWFDEASNRWFKATYRDRFGLAWGRDGTATPREYLTRLVLQNRYFSDDIQLLAVVNSGGHLRILTSQPHIAGEPAGYDDIQRWFCGLGFVQLEEDGRIAWYRHRENLLISDTHEGNVIQTPKGDLVPIDLNLIQPQGALKEWACNY